MVQIYDCFVKIAEEIKLMLPGLDCSSAEVLVFSNTAYELG